MIHFYDTFIISPEKQFVWILELFDFYVINPSHDLKSNKKIHYMNVQVLIVLTSLMTTHCNKKR